MWTYRQSTGELIDNAGVIRAVGYSGSGQGKNNPYMQGFKNIGPIPQGEYQACIPPEDTKTHGPYVIWLTPDDRNIMYDREGFGIHGDSLQHPGLASQGCMIFERSARVEFWESGDHRLKVIA